MIRECSFCILRIKFNIDLSFSEMRRLYRIEFINAYYTQREKEIKNQEELVRQINKTNSGGRMSLVKNIFYASDF